jgi:hypothetical protein
MSINKTNLAALAISFSLLIVLPGQSWAKIKCWTNKEGVRECGNSIPPEYSQQETVEKSAAGVTVQTRVRAKTKEELEAERIELERETALAAEQERLAREQAQRDRMLLHTYTTEEDLILTRDGQLAAIDSRIKHAEQITAKLRESLSESEGEAAQLERSGKKLTPDLKNEIDKVRTQLQNSEVSIARRQQEKSELKDKFAGYLARFRELKGLKSTAQ